MAAGTPDPLSGRIASRWLRRYNALYKTGRAHEAACWAHVHRKFFNVDKAQPESFAATILAAIAQLYVIEKEINGHNPLIEHRCDKPERVRLSLSKKSNYDQPRAEYPENCHWREPSITRWVGALGSVDVLH